MTTTPGGGNAPDPHDPDRGPGRPTPTSNQNDLTTAGHAPANPAAHPGEVEDVLQAQRLAEVREELVNEMRLARRARIASVNVAREIRRHLPRFEPGEDLEDGGPLRDDSDASKFQWRAEARFEAGPFKLHGKSAGPAKLAPLLVWAFLMAVGAIIWATTSNWIPGAAVMAISSLMLLLNYLWGRRAR